MTGGEKKGAERKEKYIEITEVIMNQLGGVVDTLDWTGVKLGHFQPPNRQGAPSLPKHLKKDSYAVYIFRYERKKEKNVIVFERIQLKLSQA